MCTHSPKKPSKQSKDDLPWDGDFGKNQVGGYGSGNHRSRTHMVESCLVIDIGKVLRDFACDRFPALGGWIHIQWPGLGFETKLKCTVAHQTIQVVGKSNSYQIEQTVCLQSRPIANGGRVTYALCPSCERRCFKLILLPGEIRIGCLQCQPVSYESQNANYRLNKGILGMVGIAMRYEIADEKIEHTKLKRLDAKRRWRAARRRAGFRVT